MDNPGITIFDLGIVEVAVAEDDDFIAYNTFPGRGAVQAYLAGILFAWNDIRLKPFTIIYIADHHLFIGKHARSFQNRFVYRNTSFIRNIGFRYGSHMDLRPQHTSQHNPTSPPKTVPEKKAACPLFPKKTRELIQ
jgi:hypothetical protein